MNKFLRGECMDCDSKTDLMIVTGPASLHQARYILEEWAVQHCSDSGHCICVTESPYVSMN